jgi:hypothetical protein
MTRRRRTAIVLGVIVAILALPAIYLAWLHVQVGGALSRREIEINAVLEGVSERSWRVPPVLGSPEPGNGWDLLRPALKEIQDADPLQILLRESALERCRQALRRSAWEWSGAAEPDLAQKVDRASQAFWAKANQAQKAGRDAEVLEWSIAACSVAQMAAWTGQEGTWASMQRVERWLCDLAHLVLSGHHLMATDLLEAERRIDQLRANRPPFRIRLRLCAAQDANRLLRNQIYALSDDPAVPPIPLLDTAGWRDLYSRNVFAARILNDIDDCVRQMEALSWSPSGTFGERAEAIRSQSRFDTVRSLLPGWRELTHEQETLLRLDLFRLALAFARAQMQTGRFPSSASDAGLPMDLGLPLRVDDDRIEPQPGEPLVELVWVIRRRTKD